MVDDADAHLLALFAQDKVVLLEALERADDRAADPRQELALVVRHDVHLLRGQLPHLALQPTRQPLEQRRAAAQHHIRVALALQILVGHRRDRLVHHVLDARVVPRRVVAEELLVVGGHHLAVEVSEAAEELLAHAQALRADAQALVVGQLVLFVRVGVLLERVLVVAGHEAVLVLHVLDASAASP